jgi:predicted ATPase
VFALGYLGVVLAILGHRDQGRARFQEGLKLARELSHPFSIGFALSWVATDHLNAGEPQRVLDEAEALIALANEHGFPRWLGSGTFMHGWALVGLGQVEEGLARMRAVVAAMRDAGTRMGMTGLLRWVAQACGRAGIADEGLNMLEEAFELVEQTGERLGLAMLHATRGDLLLATSEENKVEAEACFRDALEVARTQSAKLAELRAATSLARLWKPQARREEARDLLAPIYNWFTEGFDTRDLKEAKALLDELA